MKKTYKAPQTEVVRLRLLGSVLEAGNINDNASTGGAPGGVPAKEFSFLEEEPSNDIWSKEEE